MKLIITGNPHSLRYLFGIAFKFMRKNRVKIDVEKEKFNKKDLMELDRNSLKIIVKSDAYINDVDLNEDPTKEEMVDAIIEANGKDKRLHKVDNLENELKEKNDLLKAAGEEIIVFQKEVIESNKLLEEANKTIDSLNNVVSEQATKITNLEVEIANLNKDIILNNNDLKEAMKTINSLNKEISKLKKQAEKSE